MIRLQWVQQTVLMMILGVMVTEPARAYEVDPSAGKTTVRGQITLRGPAPPAERVTVRRDSAFCGETVLNESLLVDRPSKGIAAVVVSLEGVMVGKPLPEDRRLVLENRACRFSPRVKAVPAGSQLEINNADPVLHNTHIRKSDATFLNVALPPGGKTIRKPLADPGRLDVRCDAHRFMQATIHVFAHPYFAVTDQAGKFELAQVPPGTYRLRVWHEILGTQERIVTVPAQGQAIANMELQASN
jgi:plastocyanin